MVALKAGVFVLGLLPLVRLFVLGVTGGLGANPVEFVTRSTGTWTLVMLCVVLAVTPLRRLSGWGRLMRLRRMLGLFVFFYALLHVTTWVWLDRWFDVAGMLADVVKRPFITAGFTAFVLLVPLALTSSDAMIRRLGRRWTRLHRAVYLVAVLSILHFWWAKAGKNLWEQPLVYGSAVALLLAWRVIYAGSRRSSA